jgi:hypothetical protein
MRWQYQNWHVNVTRPKADIPVGMYSPLMDSASQFKGLEWLEEVKRTGNAFVVYDINRQVFLVKVIEHSGLVA